MAAHKSSALKLPMSSSANKVKKARTRSGETARLGRLHNRKLFSGLQQSYLNSLHELTSGKLIIVVYGAPIEAVAGGPATLSRLFCYRGLYCLAC